MSDTVISAEGLGKSYIIGHQQQEPYIALRDVVTNGVKQLWSRLCNPQYHTHSQIEEFWALKDVNFEISQGDRVGIIGRNGAGKSTLLKVLSRITEPTTGRVKIAGRVASLLEVGTGFHPELTGRENIFLNGAILGMGRVEIKNKFDEIVAFAEVEKFLDTPVKRYSSGMYVRLAFAVAAHLEPEILIIDEVLAVGDAEFQKKCLGKMGEVSEEGRTVLFVSHNMGAINHLCPKSILLHEGRILLIDDTKKVVESYLSSSFASSNVYEKASDKKKEINLRKVILNPHLESSSIDIKYDSSFIIRLEFEVNAKISNCKAQIMIETYEGVMVFSSADHDSDMNQLGERRPGYYWSEVTIPGKWLNSGQYLVLAAIIKNHPLHVYDRVEAISFQIIDIGTPQSRLKATPRRGVLQPYLEWNFGKIDEHI